MVIWMMKTYSELSKLKTFGERYRYLKLDGIVGSETFGYDRYINQQLYRSSEWRKTRDKVIIRDQGCDLGIPGREINKGAIIHHINPITVEQIVNNDPIVFDLDNLITVSDKTHNAIHYGDENKLYKEPITRKPNDTIPWRK